MFAHLPKKVQLIEVAARDGLQNEPAPIAMEDKFTFIQKLVKAGHKEIELTSFVKAQAIPQLADAAALVTKVNAAHFPADVRFSCLVPNLKGLEHALMLEVKEIAIFLATSDSFSQRNIRSSVEESFARIAPVVKAAQNANMRVRGYLSTVFGCPYEGEIAVERVTRLAQDMLQLGCYEISLGDTTGVAHPLQVKQVLDALFAQAPFERFALHFHDTRGMAIANVVAGLQMGITRFDGSAGGLGGCPYAKGASGNVATEELVYLFDKMGIETGVDLSKLRNASRFMLEKLGKSSPSKLYSVLEEAEIHGTGI